jgi:hypothetical protein
MLRTNGEPKIVLVYKACATDHSEALQIELDSRAKWM